MFEGSSLSAIYSSSVEQWATFPVRGNTNYNTYLHTHGIRTPCGYGVHRITCATLLFRTCRAELLAPNKSAQAASCGCLEKGCDRQHVFLRPLRALKMS